MVKYLLTLVVFGTSKCWSSPLIGSLGRSTVSQLVNLQSVRLEHRILWSAPQGIFDGMKSLDF